MRHICKWPVVTTPFLATRLAGLEYQHVVDAPTEFNLGLAVWGLHANYFHTNTRTCSFEPVTRALLNSIFGLGRAPQTR
jgi:hypothetical protein